jgi:hypothetical protein
LEESSARKEVSVIMLDVVGRMRLLCLPRCGN